MEISFEELKKLLGSAGSQSAEQDSIFVGERVIVRSRDAGVMYGTLEKLNGRYVRLSNARIIWRWRNANGGVSLNDTAIGGVSDDDYSRLSNFNEKLEMLEACSIIKVTEEAKKSLDNRSAYCAHDD